MEKLTNLARGLVRVEIKGVRTEDILNLCALNGVGFWDAEPVDGFTLRITVHRRNLTRVLSFSEKSQCTAEILKTRGAPYFIGRLRKRYTLFVGLVLCIFTLMCSSLFIWDIEVVGNSKVSSSEVLNALEDIGVGIGTYWPSMVSDAVRSKVLLRLPDVAWLTVNIHGSRAEVIVRESIPKPELLREDVTADIFASKPGIITNIQAYRGAVQVKPGQTVMSGELLVASEVTSLLSPPRYVRAMADVTARTWHELTAAQPLEIETKSYTGKSFVKNALIIGNSRINLYFSSGISDAGCDKIIKVSKAALDGVFTLPVALVSERYIEYVTEKREIDANLRQRELEDFLITKLREKIGNDGEVVSHAYSAVTKDGVLYVTLRAECVETISAMREYSD